MSLYCCGPPKLPAAQRAAHEADRRAFLELHGPQSAALFDYVYGYGTSNACGQNISYYQQFEDANGDHCDFPHYADREEQIDQYRGLNCRRLPGWDKRMQNKVGGGCCSYWGSCNGTLPYPYAQAQLQSCDPETLQGYAYNGSCCGSCLPQRPRYTWALDQPKQYPHTPYPAAYYMQNSRWPYGEQAPTLQTVDQIAQSQCCKQV